MEENIRYTYIFDDDISKESIQNTIDILHTYPEVDLYFSTDGGEVVTMDIFTAYLNSRVDEITVHLTNNVASAGAYILTDFKGEIILEDGLDFIMFHQADRLSLSFRKSGLDETILKKQLKEANDKSAAKFKELGLTDKEIKDYNSGKDVFLYRKDFHRLKLNKQ